MKKAIWNIQLSFDVWIVEIESWKTKMEITRYGNLISPCLEVEELLLFDTFFKNIFVLKKY
jgi:hypothetical protein